MLSFHANDQIRHHREFQGCTLSSFSYEGGEPWSAEDVLEAFLRSPAFDMLLPSVVRENPDTPYLRHAFQPETLKKEDFRSYSKAQVEDYLGQHASTWDSAEDRADFLALLEAYLPFHQAVPEACAFFVLSLDWFDQGDYRLKEPESWCYTSYFLILWIDPKTSILSASLWTYD